MHSENGYEIIRSGRALVEAFERYTAACAAEEAFPNLAGFCRFCRIGEEQLERWKRRFPAAYDFVMTALEDEALNAAKSASLVTAYLKRRLGYGESSEEAGPTILIGRGLMDDGE
ncbi:MAG: hypothetical protein IJC15_00765 [Clostridia bacterium]|nr:hypothetical protein [Clostridia bacterium]